MLDFPHLRKGMMLSMISVSLFLFYDSSYAQVYHFHSVADYEKVNICRDGNISSVRQFMKEKNYEDFSEIKLSGTDSLSSSIDFSVVDCENFPLTIIGTKDFTLLSKLISEARLNKEIKINSNAVRIKGDNNVYSLCLNAIYSELDSVYFKPLSVRIVDFNTNEELSELSAGDNTIMLELINDQDTDLYYDAVFETKDSFYFFPKTVTVKAHQTEKCMARGFVRIFNTYVHGPFVRIHIFAQPKNNDLKLLDFFYTWQDERKQSQVPRKIPSLKTSEDAPFYYAKKTLVMPNDKN